MNNKNFNFEVKEVTNDEKYFYITGIASTPDVDRSDDIVVQSALLESVQRIGLPAFMHQHNMKEKPLGVCTGVTLQDGNTVVNLKMPKNARTEEIKELAEMGAYQGLSIGFACIESDINEVGIRVIKKLDWYEVSLVTVPCNANARLVQVKNKNTDVLNEVKTIRDVENLLVDFGCSKKEAGYIIRIVKSAKGEPVTDEGKGEPNQDEKNIEALIELRNFLKN